MDAERTVTAAPTEGSVRVRRRIAMALALLVAVVPMLVSSVDRAIATAITPTPMSPLPTPDVDGHAGSYAWGVATMPDGSIVVGDYWNGRVLHYGMNGADLGVLFDISGGGPVGPNTTPYGLAVDADGVVYVGTYYLVPKIPSVIQRWAPDPVTGDYHQIAPISYSGFQYPSRVAVGDDGRVYVADMYANKIFVFNAAGSFLFSWGSEGTGNGQFRQPRGIALDGSNPQRVYVADANNVRVQVFNSTNGAYLFTIKTRLKGNLRGLAIDRDAGKLYVVSIGGQTVFKYDLSGVWERNIGTAGGLSQTTCCSTPGGQFSNGGREVAVDGNGNVWVGDMPNFRVQVFSPTGQFLFARPDPPQHPPHGGFNAPRGVGVDAAGNVIVADTYNQRLQKFDANGDWDWSLGVRGIGSANGYFLNYPGAVSTDPDDRSIVIADTQNNKVKKFTAGGTFVWQIGGNAGAGPGLFSQPAGVAVGADGRVFVADTRNKRVQVLNGATGAFQSQFGSANLTTPTGIVVDHATGNVYVTDPGRKAIQVFSSSGAFIRSITNTQMRRPYGVAVDDTRVFAVDRGQNKFFVFNKGSGAFMGSFGGLGGGIGQLRDPQSMAYHGGKIYISDVQNDRIAVWCVDSSCST